MTSAAFPSSDRRFYGAHHDVFEVTLHEPDAAVRRLPEALVQDLWRTQRFDAAAMRTTDDLPITVLDPGILNGDGGPDFRNAHVRIGDTEWHGDVEIHVTSGGWFEHRHHLDARYDSVVLHVALHADLWTGGLLRADGSPLPEVVLYPHLGESLRGLLHAFHTRPAEGLLCAEGWADVPDTVRHPYLAELAQERIRAKTARLATTYLHTPDLEQILHERMFAGLGYAKNTEAMTLLARRVPLALVRQLDDPLDIEALHLGAAGLLPAPADLLGADRLSADYTMDLMHRFDRLRLRFDVRSMPRTQWQFFRLRPPNFPPLRIAQASALVAPGGPLRRDALGLLIEVTRAEEPATALRDVMRVRPGAFWDTHFRLEKATALRDPGIGQSRADALLINAIVPVLLLYAEQTGDPELDAALHEVLRGMPPEKDEITRRFADLGTRPKDALAAQGLHQLYRTRCAETRCLTCAIGQHLLQRRT